MLRPDEVEEVTGLTVPEDGPYETARRAASWPSSGASPHVGDEVEVPGVRLRVEPDGRPPGRARARAPRPQTDDDEDDA